MKIKIVITVDGDKQQGCPVARPVQVRSYSRIRNGRKEKVKGYIRKR